MRVHQQRRQFGWKWFGNVVCASKITEVKPESFIVVASRGNTDVSGVNGP